MLIGKRACFIGENSPLAARPPVAVPVKQLHIPGLVGTTPAPWDDVINLRAREVGGKRQRAPGAHAVLGLVERALAHPQSNSYVRLTTRSHGYTDSSYISTPSA